MARRPGCLESSFRNGPAFGPEKGLLGLTRENTESEGHAVRVVGVVIVGVAVVVDIAEVVGVAGIRRTLPPPVRNRTTIQDLTRAGF